MTRSITQIALAQALVVILGFFALGIVLKASGYPENPTWVRWNTMALFLRYYGGWFLLLPIVWTLISLRCSSNKTGRSLEFACITLGIVLVAGVALLFVYAALNPFTRPFAAFNR